MNPADIEAAYDRYAGEFSVQFLSNGISLLFWFTLFFIIGWIVTGTLKNSAEESTDSADAAVFLSSFIVRVAFLVALAIFLLIFIRY